MSYRIKFKQTGSWENGTMHCWSNDKTITRLWLSAHPEDDSRKYKYGSGRWAALEDAAHRIAHTMGLKTPIISCIGGVFSIYPYSGTTPLVVLSPVFVDEDYQAPVPQSGVTISCEMENE